MPARDLYHNAVCTALEKDGWIITDDPLVLTIGLRSIFVDLGAEKLIAAERGPDKIAVEVKSFLSPSPISDLEVAWGQYFLYAARTLQRQEPDRLLYLAVTETIFQTLFVELTFPAKSYKHHIARVLEPASILNTPRLLRIAHELAGLSAS
ncbi:MAG: XisH family protein [Nodosilinea sp.]